MRSWSNVSVTDVRLGWWYWGAVNYIVPLQLPKRSQLSFSASLSAKLAIQQLFMDARRLFFTRWRPSDCLEMRLCRSFERNGILSEQMLLFNVGHEAQVPLIHANNPPQIWEWNSEHFFSAFSKQFLIYESTQRFVELSRTYKDTICNRCKSLEGLQMGSWWVFYCESQLRNTGILQLYTFGWEKLSI